MIKSNKLVGGSVIALAIALGAGAALADRAQKPFHGFGGPAAGLMQPFDFATADADKDGKLTPEEMKAYHANALKAIDANGDGLISVEELTAARLKAVQAKIEAQSKAMVERRDADGDGKLSAAELLAPPMPAGMFDRLDANKDGSLSAEELQRPRMAPDREGRGWKQDGREGRGPQDRGHHDRSHQDRPHHDKGAHDKDRPGPQGGPADAPPAPPAPPAAPAAPQN